MMVRYIDNFSVTQRTSDGYFDGSELLRQWNSLDGNPRRQMSKFLEMDSTRDFMKALAIDESQSANLLIGENQLLIKVRGRNTKDGKMPDKVWMNPLLFIKFAMWINPVFEVKVLRFVYDEMIRCRNDAGDAYKELSSAVMTIVPNDFMPKAMKKVGEALNWIVFNSHEKMLRNKHGDEVKQRELYQLEKKVADLINEGFLSNYETLLKYLRVQYQKRNCPQVFEMASANDY